MYRRPFRPYSERRLTFLSVLYAQLSIACLVIFIVKYRIEYILALPLVATLFCIYFYIGLKPQSVAQAPEKLFTTYLDLPFLQPLLNVHFLRISW
jgi:decaprenyl-phosphate phosphoribosyltransferase